MIFVTVGEQLPFDRLIMTVDDWAKNEKKDVFAQIGRSSYKPKACKYSSFLDSNEFKKLIEEAEFIISHAGMGTIITAIEYNKNIIVMPRNSELGEVRNQHQFDTAKKFSDIGILNMAMNEYELMKKLYKVDRNNNSNNCISKNKNYDKLINNLKSFINKI